MLLTLALLTAPLAVGCSQDRHGRAGGRDTSSPSSAHPAAPLRHSAIVDEVIDGDTLATASRQRVRLVQIDAPESTRHDECYGAEATAELTALVPGGSRIVLERDPALDDRDGYGRLLRYVHIQGLNVNRELVRRGAASVWYYRGSRGRYAGELYDDVKFARARGLGLWGQCRDATFDVRRGVDT